MREKSKRQRRKEHEDHGNTKTRGNIMTEYEIKTVQEHYKERTKHTHRNYLIQMILTIGFAGGLGFKVLKNGLRLELTDMEGLILLLGIAAIAGFIIIKCNRAAGLKYALYVQEAIKSDQNFYVEELNVCELSRSQSYINKDGNSQKIENSRYYALFCYMDKQSRITCEINHELYLKLKKVIEQKDHQKTILASEPFKNKPIRLLRWFEDEPKD